MTEQNTYLADVIDETEYRSRYDDGAKHLVANRPVLARIIKATTKEFADYEVDEIEDCIEGEPQVSQVNVYPEKVKSQKITGQPTESKIPNEGKVTFDIRLTAVTRNKERIKIMLNVENDLIRMLTVLLSHKLDAETKKKILEKEHGMKMTEKMMGGMSSMCNLSELVWEEGAEHGQAIARCNAIRMLSSTMPVKVIVDLMKYEEEFVKAIVELLHANPDATDEEIVGMMKTA